VLRTPLPGPDRKRSPAVIDSATEQPVPLFAIAGADEKTCNACHTAKPLAEFSRNARWADGLARACKACLAARARAAYWRDPEKYRRRSRSRARKPVLPEDQRRYQLRWAYGITPEDYDRMFRAQEGRCKICRGPATAVDHDHETGQVRGLLCRPCNSGLGHFRDSLEFLRRAVAYLEASPQVAPSDPT
jgi:hypothetical protein